MKSLVLSILLLLIAGIVHADDDKRERVDLPEMMKKHMLSNMRDHLVAIDQILSSMAAGNLDEAAQIAETRLGMSSLDSHGAAHMAKRMPEGMRKAGTDMHRAASQFALRAQEGEAGPAYEALTRVTGACVACHSAYRIH
jgi:cytochrome c556